MRRRYCASGLVAPPGRDAQGVAGVEDHRAAALHEGVEAADRKFRRLRPACDDRPVEQRIEGELVPIRVDADRIARLERRAIGEDVRQAGQARLAGAVDLRIAGDDVGEAGHERGLVALPDDGREAIPEHPRAGAARPRGRRQGALPRAARRDACGRRGSPCAHSSQSEASVSIRNSTRASVKSAALRSIVLAPSRGATLALRGAKSIGASLSPDTRELTARLESTGP